jgi:hypothetical protein
VLSAAGCEPASMARPSSFMVGGYSLRFRANLETICKKHVQHDLGVAATTIIVAYPTQQRKDSASNAFKAMMSGLTLAISTFRMFILILAPDLSTDNESRAFSRRGEG